jgi:hypothetical protein
MLYCVTCQFHECKSELCGVLCSDVMRYARVGPPLFFVVEDMNLSQAAPDIRGVCGSAGCSDHSLVNMIAQAAQNPAATYIATPAASWIDDFFAWVQPELPNCCRSHPNGTDGLSKSWTSRCKHAVSCIVSVSCGFGKDV